jgi:hypothetical protein
MVVTPRAAAPSGEGEEAAAGGDETSDLEAEELFGRGQRKR